jgi:hypothetical protein
VPATFFNIGQNMAASPSLVRTEAQDGYMVGNHTWDHPDMTTLSASAQGAEMDRASAELHSITGTWPCAFRPPYGSYNSTTESLAQQRRMKFWTWSVDTEDWKAAGSSSSYWVNRIVSLAESEGGALQHPVVLMHNAPSGDPATALALPTIIKYFRDRGYTFVDLAGNTTTQSWSSRQASQAAAQASGVVDVLYKAADTTLGHQWYNPRLGWRAPVSMGGQVAGGEPSVTTSVPGTIDAFWQGADGGLWHAFTTGRGWGSGQPMNVGALGGPPKAVAQPDGTVAVFWRGTDGQLWYASFVRGSGWSAARSLGGALASDPAPVASSLGTVDVFWAGTDGQLWHVYQTPGHTWSAPVNLNVGTVGGGPAATGQASGTVDVFWHGSGNNHLWHTYYRPGGGWHPASDLGGDLPSTVPVAAVTSAPGTVDVFWQGAGGSLWHAYTTAGHAWQPPASLGMGPLGGAPFAAAQPDATIDVFWRGSGNDHLWHGYYRTGHGWNGPQDLGGHLYPTP